ncbi:MAG: discoidin domain-containing protein [Planctomycetota bacterium]
MRLHKRNECLAPLFMQVLAAAALGSGCADGREVRRAHPGAEINGQQAHLGPPHKSLEEFATVEAYCEGKPVYAFGYTYVYGVSPDFIPDLVWQQGARGGVKLVPKKSWEIKNNLLGSTPAREPRSRRIDDQPLLCAHLIDGDPETCWCSRAQIKADFEPVWIRIDLPAEAELSAVRLVPSKKGMRGFAPIPSEPTDTLGIGQGLPRKLTVKLSRDAYRWETIYETQEFAIDPAMDPIDFRFEPRRAKQVWIVGEEFPEVLGLGHCFSIAGVEVLSSAGVNLALHSRGAGVTVSSTHLGYGMDRFTQDMLWPIQYDLGFKWARVGYDMSALQWAYVERKKGVLAVDPHTDAAITQAVQHGIEVVLVLDKGNWLRAPEPRFPQRNRELMETYYNRAPWPDPAADPEYFAAWLDYVRHMVRHFKDRVRYFEIWNEWNVPVPPENAQDHRKQYVRLAAPTARVIREECPEARIVLGSTSGLDSDLIEEWARELNGLVDVIGFHPYYHADPQEIREYPELIASLKERLATLGFKGELMATEWSWFAPYPAAARDPHRFTELQKAKIAARFATVNVALGVPCFWNETFQTQMTSRDVSLLRNTFTADPISPTQPQPVYYVLRTLSTALEDVRPAGVDVRLTPSHPDLEWYALERGNGNLLVALWLAGEAVDDASRETVLDLRVPAVRHTAVDAIDTLNGTRHHLRADPGSGLVQAIHVRDWPLVIEFHLAR